MVSRPELIDTPVYLYKPLPSDLTDPILKPPPPPRRCLLGGKPAVCVADALALIPLYDADIDLANADRRRAALLGGSDVR